MVEGLSWHWIFWLNVPIGVVAALLACASWRRASAPPSRRPARALLVSAGSFGLVWGLVRGNEAGWGSVEVVSSLVLGALLVAAFVRWESVARSRCSRPHFWRSRAFSAGNPAIFLTFASLFTGVFFFAQLLQVVSAHARWRPGCG